MIKQGIMQTRETEIMENIMKINGILLFLLCLVLIFFLIIYIFFSFLTRIVEIISITSYNEWHEGNLYLFNAYVYLYLIIIKLGTQIEAAIPKTITETIFANHQYSYVDYSPLPPDYYMIKTNEWAKKFMDSKE